MGLDVTYKGNQIAQLTEDGNLTLETAGKYCEGDIELAYSGGGDQNPIAEENDVIFIDYDGTIRYSYSLDEIEQMTELPPGPNHRQDEIPLIFSGWNWTLQEIKDWGYPCEIGATYDTIDDQFKMVVEISNLADATITFHGRIHEGSVMDWGDGATSIVGSDYYASVSHTYTKCGRYICSFDSKKRTISYVQFIQGSGRNITEIYTGRYIGVNIWSGSENQPGAGDQGILSIKKIAFSNNSSTIALQASLPKLRALVLPHLNYGNLYFYNFLVGASRLEICSVPPTTNRWISNDMKPVYSLRRITLMNWYSSSDYASAENCRSLTNLIFSEYTEGLRNYVFRYATALKRVRFLNEIPFVIEGSGVFTYLPPDCTFVFPYASTSYLTATNYPSSTTYLYIGFYKGTSNEQLPETAGEGTYSLIWYGSIEDAQAETNPITTMQGREVFCRYAAIENND